MRMTSKDHEERAARLADGTGSDDDRRLVKLYESMDHASDSEQPSVSHSVALDDGARAADAWSENERPTSARKRGAR